MHRDLPLHPVNMRVSVVARIAVVFVAAFALVAGLGVGGAHADELDDRRQQLDRALSENKGRIEHYSQELTTTLQALEEAEASLAAAEADLAAAEAAHQQALDAALAAEALAEEARELEEQRKAEEHQAERDLSRAEAQVAAARAAWESTDRRATEEVNVITQQSGPLLDLALLFTDVSMSNLNQRAQLSSTLFESTAMRLDELQERRFILEQAELEAAQARQAAEDAREAAEEARAAAEEASRAAEAERAAAEAAEASAAAVRSSMADLVASVDAAREANEQALTTEQARQTELEVESAEVDRRIQERIRQQEEADRLAREQAARDQAARDQAAREQAARDQAAREEAARNNAAAAPPPASTAAAPSSSPAPATATSSSSSRSASTTSRSANRASTPATTGSGFVRPVPGRITSAYGPRVHPILGVRRLHDGTDFAGACGSPIKAAADGVVAERYYHNAYGWRLMIDHGRVDGTYVTTGYNHATRYVVGRGQRVTKGQTIGYVGTTGYSTGCHLHLMVWQGGSLVNPMAKWFR